MPQKVARKGKVEVWEIPIGRITRKGFREPTRRQLFNILARGKDDPQVKKFMESIPEVQLPPNFFPA
jgi:hypothetical protein